VQNLLGGRDFEFRRFLGSFALALFGFGLLASAVVAVSTTHPQGGPSDVLHLDAPRVVVLKAKRQLILFDGDTLIRTYAIDLGTSPAGQKVRAGDGRTPEGSFFVVTKNADSRFHRFLGISYPGPEAVTAALARGLISKGEAAAIVEAIHQGRRPPWRTALGGGIGIHGHRRGRDWTGGCVAVSDAQIEELFSVLRPGDPVEILP